MRKNVYNNKCKVNKPCEKKYIIKGEKNMFFKLRFKEMNEKEYYIKEKEHLATKQGSMVINTNTFSSAWQPVHDKMNRMCKEPYNPSDYWAGKKIR